jgi:serine/threonine protein kinase
MPDIAQDFLKQVSKGLLYMHQHDIIHCDISPSNILIDDTSGCMYICDFGCAHSYSDASSTHNDRHVVEEIGTR